MMGDIGYGKVIIVYFGDDFGYQVGVIYIYCVEQFLLNVLFQVVDEFCQVGYVLFDVWLYECFYGSGEDVYD